MHLYRPLNTIRAMTFDLDDTLYDNGPVITRAVKNMWDNLAQLHPISQQLSHEQWMMIKDELGEKYPMLRHDVTAWRQQFLYLGLIQSGYLPHQAETATQELMTRFMDDRCRIDMPDETHYVLGELAKKIPLVAITNGNVDFKRIGLADYFQFALMAGVDGISKPAPDLYNRASELLNIKPNEILHIGDHLKTDVAGSIQAGYQGCWFNDQQRDVRKDKHASLLPHLEISSLTSLLDLVYPPHT
ncbi:5-amino-6-(5-phospho-D-ribitylamino)uracil phosphatase YigB [Vibrio sp. SS-MA-C1-2]|uniref:5-amino-6-(5-phospho-D-ribitylamino)uracil phosphatase YigB n=1 Tax=Vibrio sp. SS-MA-C1-2 TaxID=2908646 RepID=UPI001F1E69F9|nr:5-amino-6-(5-phospho-D-ribitylamino)uracil phosphatase YigB [Vibrio sp. SS-MA-C1-2]UJF19412.1 5-amino-6-(5-phospho-D-ribitylamino)uracil phosphatase YigB [Vibrio sp. SS-MA-C1-2]